MRDTDALLANLAADPEAVRAHVQALEPAGLERYGLRGVYLNQLMLLGSRMPRERVRTYAESVVRNRLLGEWEFHAYLQHFNREVRGAGVIEDPSARSTFVWLNGWDLARIRALAAEGNGLILCSFHLGPFRFIPFDLGLLGLRMLLPLDRAAFEDTAAARETLDARMQGLFGLTPVDIGSSMVALLKALRRGDILFVYLDGNTGLDGFTGDQGRTEITFEGLPIRVKSGIPRLAAATGATLLPLIAVRQPDGTGRVFLDEPIRPGGRLKGEAREVFVRETTQALYDVLATRYRTHPDQWDSVAYLHRWRVPTSEAGATLDPAPTAARVRLHLRGGGALRLAADRVLDIGGEDAPILVSVRDLKAIRPPRWARSLLRPLLAGAPLDQAALAEHGVADEDEERVHTLLAHLLARGVIVPEAGVWAGAGTSNEVAGRNRANDGPSITV